MKNIIALLLISFLAINSYGQDEEMKPVTGQDREEESPKGGFKKENLFLGGGLQLSFSSYDFVVGGSPVIGYSINKWVDVGVGLNVTYISERRVQIDANGYEYATGDKIHQTDIAPVVYTRIYPIKFLFVQAQVEQNFISQKYIYADGFPSDKAKVDATSLLLGVGYANGRERVGDFYYYLSLSIDVLKNRYSPYVQIAGNGTVNILPILRAGIQVPLFQGKRNRY
jgi:hypothetical protein